MVRHKVTTLTPSLCCAARAYVGWSRAQLAEAAGLNPETVKNYETSMRPNAKRGSSLGTEVLIEAALKAEGFEFFEGGFRHGDARSRP